MSKEHWITVAKITTVFGIKGWVKIHSYTEPGDNLFKYTHFRLSNPVKGARTDAESLQIDAYQRHGKGFIAHIKGCDDRNTALQFVQQKIQVAAQDLENLEEGEFYWHQLEGLTVWAQAAENAEFKCLGKISHLLETGANDVLVVKPSADSIDERERLIPYIDQVVRRVALEEQRIELVWDASFLKKQFLKAPKKPRIE